MLRIEVDNDVFADTSVGKLLTEAYPERIAKQTEKFSVRYKLANGRIAKLQDHDPLVQKQWLSIASADLGTNEGKIFSAAPVDGDDLASLAKEKERVAWDSDRGIIVAQSEKQIGAIVLSSKPLMKVNEQLRITALCEALHEEGLQLLDWSETHEQWQARVLSLRKWRPDQIWPNVSEEILVETSNEWLAPFLLDVNNRQDFKRLDLTTILTGMLTWELQQQFVKLVPDRIQVPSGSLIKIEYSPTGDAPVMKVRLQEIFGLNETPTVNEGLTKIIIHLLSPGYKPVQVTQDLKSFWNTTYHEVRKELRVRYPKHHWPENPWTAEAVRGVKRK